MDLLFKYYNEFKKRLNQTENPLTLEIIGDGSQREIVKKAIEKDKNILWHGTLVNEAEIAPIMERCSLVFIPGHSGLSINHAFAYGRPYITIESETHAPEINYLEHGINGLD